MNTATVELSNVIYNAANQSFEALATIYDGTTARKIACAIDAPIDMSFEDAACGLTTHALRRANTGKTALGSRRITGPIAPQRAGRPDAKLRFDAFEMLRRVAA